MSLLSRAAAVLCLIAGIACGGSNSKTPSPSPVPSDWQAFSAQGFQLSLPPSFVGGEPGGAALQRGVQQLLALGQDEMAAKLQAFTPNTVLQMIDSDGSAAVSVFWSSVPPTGFKLADHDIFASLNPSSSGLRLISRKTVPMGPLSAERLEMHNDAVNVDLVAYYVTKDAKMWSIVYTDNPATTARWTPVFDQSASSIRLAD